MQKIIIVLIAILIVSCIENKKENSKFEKQNEKEEVSANFDWLLGKWKRLNEEEGKETFENWKKISNTEYSGIGFTMQNGDTIKQERIRLTKLNDKWDIIVKVPEEAKSITFKGTSHNENEFTCENKELDFPNKIKYWKNGDRINAMVSGGEMKIPFEFEKLK